MTKYFKLVCLPEDPDWYIREFLEGRARFGWSGPDCDLRKIKSTDWPKRTELQRNTWSYTKFLIERIEVGSRIVVQVGQPISNILIGEVIDSGYDFHPGNLDDFNHMLYIRPITKTLIPINSNAISLALKHDLSKRGHYYEIYPVESVAELNVLVDKIRSSNVDFKKIRTDSDTYEETLMQVKEKMIKVISRKWPAKNFERFCANLLRRIDHIEVKDQFDSGLGWDLLVRIINPLTQTILLDNIPVQCKNYHGIVNTLDPIDDLERSVRNSTAQVAYLMIIGELPNKFFEAAQLRQESLKKELNRPISFEIITEDRIAEMYATVLINPYEDNNLT